MNQQILQNESKNTIRENVIREERPYEKCGQLWVLNVEVLVLLTGNWSFKGESALVLPGATQPHSHKQTQSSKQTSCSISGIEEQRLFESYAFNDSKGSVPFGRERSGFRPNTIRHIIWKICAIRPSIVADL